MNRTLSQVVQKVLIITNILKFCCRFWNLLKQRLAGIRIITKQKILKSCGFECFKCEKNTEKARKFEQSIENYAFFKSSWITDSWVFILV